MSHVPLDPSRSHVWQAGGVGLVTGLLSALSLNPLGEFSGTLPWWPGEMLGFMSIFALSAGLIYGVLGGGFARLRLRFSKVAVAVFALTSVGGIAAAVYAAILAMGPEAAQDNFIVPYLAGGVVGGLIMAVPMVLIARLARPLWVAGRATLLTTGWSVGVATAMAVLGVDDALSVPWLLVLFCGWQALFLMQIAAADRRA
ncbi:hypothetical protein [Gymnodinialimonas ulvae]|uniref:hypothetical protein n=1 Tax=Gymnodinialimonas ulvae TaxID=3126504 RepID=UPI00309F3286